MKARTSLMLVMLAGLGLVCESCSRGPGTGSNGASDAGESAAAASNVVRRAMLADGQPAAGARIWIGSGVTGQELMCNSPGQFYGETMQRVKADSNGNFTLPAATGKAHVVFIHPKGMLATTFAEVGRSREVKLQPWGRLEGVLMASGKTKAGEHVSLATLGWGTGIHVSYSAISGTNGEFTFTNVPAGEYMLYRIFFPRPLPASGGFSAIPSHQMPAVVKAGETVKVQYGGNGRDVIGQAEADQPGVMVDWTIGDQVLVLKTKHAVSSVASFIKESWALAPSAADQLQEARTARTYKLEFERDGFFRGEDVPPGTYELRINLSKRPEMGMDELEEMQNRLPHDIGELGSLVREVVVPAGREPLDLGTLKVTMKGGAAGGRGTALNLEAQTLDGRPLSLAQFKGKLVLLTFWAAWSERSTEQLSELQKMQVEYAKNPRLVFLSVNVDEKLAEAQTVVQSRGYQGVQAWLNATNRARTTAAFEVDTLPMVMLFDQEGRVVGRDLKEERLRQMLQRSLPTQ